RGKRNAQDWIKLLQLTPLFSGAGSRNAYVQISYYGNTFAQDIDDICAKLETSDSFWKYDLLNAADRRSWYAEFGSVHLDIALIPQTEEMSVPGEQQEEEEIEIGGADVRRINLRDFDDTALGSVK